MLARGRLAGPAGGQVFFHGQDQRIKHGYNIHMTDEEKRESHRAACKRWRLKNAERLKELAKTPEQRAKSVESSVKWAKANKDKVAVYQATTRKKNAAKRAKYGSIYRDQNKDAISTYHRVHYETNKQRIKQRIYKWKKENPHLVAAANAGRKKAVKRATPKWANHGYINLWYLIARIDQESLGVPCHVDHIIPILHPLVCGLHNEHNLQVLTGPENCSKSNRWQPS